MLPDDAGGRGTDNVADDVGVVALVELLRAGDMLEGDLLCRHENTRETREKPVSSPGTQMEAPRQNHLRKIFTWTVDWASWSPFFATHL